MKSGILSKGLQWILVFGALSSAAFCATWFPLGPYGGDARSFAADPSDSHHLYLGTATGWLYESHDTGANWTRVTRLGKRDDLVLDHILVDPKNPKRLIVGAWKVDRPEGGVYISQDGGQNWYEQAQMRGQSVRAMARSASDPQEIAAGTLDGVYLSQDNGTHWKLISPEGSKELHEIESLAIDPADPKIIYAGTWHLPWKTADGGETWVNMGVKQHIIDDSDVFSIIIDPSNPKVVYMSACSGIYKSVDAAVDFKKIQGIPNTARRTRKLLQDPVNMGTVYAGTTEGLYKTVDAGHTFSRVTGPNVVVNDVYVDPSNPAHVLLATDHGGVLSSEDGAANFQASNTGFTSRLVSSFASDPHNPALLYVGVVNDRETGGVFLSQDGGARWEQHSKGLGGRDVFSLATTVQGTLLAGTSHGVYRLDGEGWNDSSDLFGAPPPSEEPVEKPQPEVKPKLSHAAPVAAHKSDHKPLAVKPPPAQHQAPSHAHIRPIAYNVQKRAPAHQVPVKPVKKAKAHASAPAHQVPARKVARAPEPPPPPGPPPPPTRLDAAVYSMVTSGDAVYAGTAQGLYQGSAEGHQWQQVAGLTMHEVPLLAAQQQMLMAADLNHIWLSKDAASTWNEVRLPSGLTEIRAIAVDDAKQLWVGGREGVFYSADQGASWKTLRNLFVLSVAGLYFDAAEHRVLVSSTTATITFAVHVPDHKVSYWETGWALRFVRPVGDHLIGATLFDGMVLQPQMVVSEIKRAQ